MVAVKRLMLLNPVYGRFALLVGIVFIGANILACAMYFYIGYGGLTNVIYLKENNQSIWIIIFLPYYILTEFLPAFVYTYALYKYGDLFDNHFG
jgi:hypothetical protein